MTCNLEQQGVEQGKCQVFDFASGESRPACEVTLRRDRGVTQRLIYGCFLSRPEHYLSVYQSGCNLSCKKCHSWRFSRYATGTWISPDGFAKAVERYLASYAITSVPREEATSWHAQKLCKSCGSCVLYGKRSARCPGVLGVDKIELSSQGWGPARNIVAFTGGDLTCQPEYYVRCAEVLKARREKIWLLLETNGYGLTSRTLDSFQQAGIDSFWLDIKAYDDAVHRRLTGVSNRGILKLPGALKDRGFVFEVLSLCIPGWVEADQIGQIAQELSAVDREIPFTILAFFPEYHLRTVPGPTVEQMLAAYRAARDAGLRKIKLGNVPLFAPTPEKCEALAAIVGRQSL
jgi:pyruvate formate lyase activating enzyme